MSFWRRKEKEFIIYIYKDSSEILTRFFQISGRIFANGSDSRFCKDSFSVSPRSCGNWLDRSQFFVILCNETAMSSWGSREIPPGFNGRFIHWNSNNLKRILLQKKKRMIIFKKRWTLKKPLRPYDPDIPPREPQNKLKWILKHPQYTEES